MKPSFNKKYFFPNCVILIFQVLGLLIAILALDKLRKSELFLDELLSNWQSKPFKSIDSFENDCPVNKYYEHLKINRYHLNCDSYPHSKNNFIQRELYESSYLLDKSNHKVCGETEKSFNYLGYLNNTYRNRTIKQFCEKNCGVVDSINNILCIKANEKCPLNKFDFLNKTESKLNSKDLIEMSDGSYFKISNDGENKKIILSLSLIEDVSFTTNTCGIKFDFPSHSKINTKIKFLRSYSNKRSDKTNNKYYVQLKDNSANYIDISNYIGWKKECFLNPIKSPNSVALYIDDYYIVYNNSDALAFRFGFFSFLCLFILFVYAPLYKMTDNTPYFYCLIVNSLFMIVSIARIMSNISISWKNLYGSPQIAFQVADCSDDYTNLKFTQLRETFISILYDDTFLFISQFVNWTIPLYIIVVIYIKKDDDEEEMK